MLSLQFSLTLGGEYVGRPDVADEPRDGDGDAAHALHPELELVHEDDGGVAELWKGGKAYK